jgi:pyruvate/2-oxoacid:ferredoxin oxidoreductase beta subunit
LEALTVGSTIAIGTSRLQRTITAISNNTFLAVDSAFTANTTGQEAYKVLNNSIGYTTPEGKSFDGFKFFAIKVVFLSTNRAYAPKIKELRAVALA